MNAQTCSTASRAVALAVLACAIACYPNAATAGGIYLGPPKPGYPLVQSGRSPQGYGVPWSAATTSPWARNGVQVHTGVDLPASRGTPVYATGPGVVTSVGPLGKNYGQYVIVTGPQGTNGYLHVSPSVASGTPVASGQIIGNVYDNHLHYNQCNQPFACQYGAYPNPAYPNAPTNTVNRYYSVPWQYGR